MIVTDLESDPALFEHDRLYVVVEPGLTDWLPLVPLLPDQPPEAVQVGEVPETLQDKLVLSPAVIVVELALKLIVGLVTTGAAFTVMLADLLLLPASLLHDNVYVVLEPGVTVFEPDAFCAPDQPPEAVQVGEVPETLQESVALCPAVIVDGLMLIVTVGATGASATDTDTDFVSLPALFEHDNV